MEEISFINLNVRSVRSDYKWVQLQTFLERCRPDVIMLQETNCTSSPLPLLDPMYSYIFNPPSQPNTGTIIAVRKSSSVSIISETTLFPGYLQEATISISKYPKQLHVFSIYLPISQQIAEKVLDHLNSRIKNVRRTDGDHADILIGGDYNTTLDPQLDRSSGKERSPRVALKLKNVVVEHDLDDVWRSFYPNKPGFTYIGNAPLYPGSRIDRCYTSSSLTSIISKIQIIPSFSDHLAVIATIMTGERKYKPPYWRFDNSLLDDENFTTCISNMIYSFVVSKHSYTNIQEWWEAMKQEIALTTIRFVRFRRQNTDEVFRRLERKAEMIINDTTLTATKLGDIANLSTDLREVYSRETEKTLARVRYEHLLHADSPAGTALSKEVSLSFRPLTCLRLNGIETSNILDLISITRTHFMELYAANPILIDDNSELFANLPKLSTQDRDVMDKTLTQMEFTEALKQLNKKKSPGIDGLTPEFYLKFWSVLGIHFTEVFTTSLEDGRLPSSVRKSVLTLLPKSGDRLDIKNWRPINLLTTDYKIITRALAKRLSPVMSTVIHQDQGYCVPGRTIFDSLHLHRDVITYANEAGINLALLSMDQQAAFDRVNHDYLFKILHTLGFGDYFCNVLSVLYSSAVSQVRVGSCLTAPFSVSQGIRQGCPLSGLLFSLTIEPFLALCRLRLRGFTLPTEEDRKLVISAYADDITVFVEKEEDFLTLATLYELYAAQSGAKLNKTKSIGLWVGKWKQRKDTPLGFTWSNEGNRFLGVNLGNDPNTHKLTFERLHTIFTASVKRWRFRAGAMSLRGRVLVANQYIAPRLWFVFQVLPPPPTLVARLQGELANFVWTGRRHCTKMRDPCAPPHLGGLGLVNIDAKVKLFRVLFAQRFIHKLEDHNCHVMTTYFLKKYRNQGIDWQIFFQPHHSVYTKEIFSSFHITVLQAWKSLEGLKPANLATTNSGFCTIPLKNTSLIPTTTRLFIPSWSDLQITTLGDLLNGTQWRNVEELTGFQKLSPRVKQAIMINFKKIQAYCHLRFRGVKEQFGPEIWPPIVTYYRKREKRQIPLCVEKDRRPLLIDIMASTIDFNETITGYWLEEKVNWKCLLRSPIMGRDAEIAWRFKKNRLADPIFLFKCSLVSSRLCPWCQVEGTAWHMLMSCERAAQVWALVNTLIKKFLKTFVINRNNIYTGFWPIKNIPRQNVDISNFLVTLATSTVYNLLVGFFKENRIPPPYEIVYTARIKSRLIKEYAWHSVHGMVDVFKDKWCIKNYLCSIKNGDLIFGKPILLGEIEM